MMKTTVVICVVLATCQVLAAQEGWAERRWEARSNACESVDSFVLLKTPDDQECNVLCGLFPLPLLVELENGSFCKTRLGEPGTCNKGECFARPVDLKTEVTEKTTEPVSPTTTASSNSDDY